MVKPSVQGMYQFTIQHSRMVIWILSLFNLNGNTRDMESGLAFCVAFDQQPVTGILNLAYIHSSE